MVQGPRSSLNASAAKFDESRTAFSSRLTGTDQGPSMPFVQAACRDPFLQERANSQANVTTMQLASVKEFRARCGHRSEEHTSQLQSLMRISYAVFCLKKKIKHNIKQ